MTNLDILINEASKVMDKDLVLEYAANYNSVPFYTYGILKKMGYQVRKGEHAIIKTKLWKLKGSKKVADDNEEVDESRFILVNANLFSLDQCDKIG